MFRKIYRRYLPAAPGFAAWMLTVAALVAMPEPLLAQTTPPFTVKINEMEDAFVTGQGFAMMNGFSQNVARSMPYIEVKNNSTANLTEFQLTIGDNNYHFSDDFLPAYAVLPEGTMSPSLTSSTTDNENRLIVMIGNGGLAQNQFVRFKIDIDADPEMAAVLPPRHFQYPNYFTVLVDNTSNPQSSDNAIPFARFANSPNLVQLSPLPDVQILGEDGLPTIYYNGVYAPFGTMVTITEVTSSNSFVPEPASALLLAMGVLGLFGLRWRSRHSQEN